MNSISALKPGETAGGFRPTDCVDPDPEATSFFEFVTRFPVT